MLRLSWLLPPIVALLVFSMLADGEGRKGLAQAARAADAAAPLRPPGDPRRDTGSRRIVMIAADWCGYCRRLRQQFDAAKVPYRLIDVETDEGRRAMSALGAHGVPVTVIGQSFVQGYDTAALDRHLTRLGYRVF